MIARFDLAVDGGVEPRQPVSECHRAIAARRHIESFETSLHRTSKLERGSAVVIRQDRDTQVDRAPQVWPGARHVRD